MRLMSQEEFSAMSGKVMPVRRDVKIFNGDKFDCACGKSHTFNVDYIDVIAEGRSGKFIFKCPNDNSLVSLIKTKMKWGMIYQGLEYLAGSRI